MCPPPQRGPPQHPPGPPPPPPQQQQQQPGPIPQPQQHQPGPPPPPPQQQQQQPGPIPQPQQHQPGPPPPPPQPQQYPPPYYNHHYDDHHHHHHRRSKRSSNSFASCLLATVFLATVVIAAIITCFILFRPQDPEIAVNSMKFPSFSLLNNTANFTFNQYVAVKNPNRYSFSHYDSSLQLFSASAGPVGFIYIPAGQIAGGRTQYMSATFDVKSFLVPPPQTTGMMNVGGGGPMEGMGMGAGTGTMELESKMKLVGTVKVMKVFAHHVEKGASCRVTIQVTDGTVLGYHC